MLQNIRDNAQGTIAKIIIGLIVISFAFFGVESLIGGRSSKVATVNGDDISPQELERAIATERNRRMNLMGDKLDPALIEPEVLRPAALQQLIQQRLLLQSAEEANIDISDRSIGQAIGNMREFQVDGKYSEQRLDNVLRSNGLNRATFKSLLHTDLVIGQLSNGVTGSEFVTEDDLRTIAEIIGQKRSFKYLTIPSEQIDDKVDVTDEDIQAYYEQSADQYVTKDRVKLDYVEIRQSDFFKPVPEEQIKEAYQLELKEFDAAEERRVSHILVQINDDRSKQAALEKAKSLRQQLVDGENFASLAKQSSDDIGSAPSGGDLGYTAGDTFPDAFEEAVFAASRDQVSEPVLTDAGYHLIKVTDIKLADKPTYEERKPVIEQRLQLDNSEADFVTAVEEMKDLAFNAESLDGPAADLNLTVQQSDWLSREGATGVLADSRVMKAAFSEEVLKDGHNSPVVELAPDHFVVVRVKAHDAPHQKPLEEVAGEIKTLLEGQQRVELAQQMAAGMMAQIGEGKSAESVAESVNGKWLSHKLVRRTDTTVNRELLQAVFGLPVPDGADTETVESVQLSTGDVAIVVLEDLQAGHLEDLSKTELMALRGEIQRALRGISTNGFLMTLREQADVEIL